MPRAPKPWRRGGPDGPWYATIDGRQTLLLGPEATFAQARRALDEARAASRRTSVRRGEVISVDQAVDLFLADVEAAVGRGDRSQNTLDGYRRFLLPFALEFRGRDVPSVGEGEVAAWAAGRGWNDTTRCNAITAVKACFNRMVRLRRLDANPVAGMERPIPRRREYAPTPEVVGRILAASPDRAFRDLLELLHRTGCRPGEVYGVEAKDVSLADGAMTVSNKTARSTGERRRVVPLTSLCVDLLRRLCDERPTGPLLLNTRGNPWTRNAVALRFRRLRERLGLPRGAVAYSLRHAFVTRALEAGVPIATVAEIVGHRDLTMIMRVYSKLGQRIAHLREAAERADRGRSE